MIAADELSRKVRDHKPHPADHAGHGDRRRGDERCAEDQHRAQKIGVHAERLCLAVAEGQQVQPPSKQQQRHESDAHRDRGDRDRGKPRAGQRTQKPVGDRGKLITWIRDKLQIGRARRKQRADHDARKDQVDRPKPRRALRDQKHKRNGEQRAEKRKDGDVLLRTAQKDRKRRPERRAVRRAEDVRRRHGVTEHALKRRARRRERTADEAGHDDARQAHADDRVLHLRRPRDRTGKPEQRKEPPPKDADDGKKRHRIAPERQRRKKERKQYAARKEQHRRPSFPSVHALHAVSSPNRYSLKSITHGRLCCKQIAYYAALPHSVPDFGNKKAPRTAGLHAVMLTRS